MSISILILLGNTNDVNHELSDIAKTRADLAVELLIHDLKLKVIPTGAFGNFNESSMPHGEILTKYLIAKGIPKERILPFTRSSNTVEDAYGVLRSVSIISEINKIVIVTSQYHMKRVKYIFGRVLQGYHLEYHEASDPITHQAETESQEEQEKLDKLTYEWVDLSNINLHVFPDKSYENLGYELRHYDNLSYYSLAGAITFCGYIFDKSLFGKFVWAVPIESIIKIVVICLLWNLYHRFANTAGAARRVMKSIEKLYGVPGLSSANCNRRIFTVELNAQYTVAIVMTFIVSALIMKSVVTLLDIMAVSR
jgi:hypothetical protein